MIKVKSYLKRDETFIPIAEYEGALEPRYIEGAIELSINGVDIITVEMWDYVDELWAYITDGLIEMQTKLEWKTNFPDQPIRFTLRTDARREHIFAELHVPQCQLTKKTSETYKAVTSFDEFIAAMSEASQHFHEHLARIVPEEREFCKDTIEKLREAIPVLEHR